MTGDQLSEVFGALADPTRRAILARLADGDATVGEIAAPFPRLPAGHLAPPQGAGAGGAHLSPAAGDRPPQPPRGRAASRGDGVAGGKLRLLGRELSIASNELLATLQQQGTQGADRPAPTPAHRGEPIMGTTRIMAEPGLPFIEIEREFAAPRELVYRAHVDPELLVRWLGPAKYAMRVERLEVRDGGRWRFVHVADDGGEFGFRGVFHGEPSVDGILQTWEFEGFPGHVSLELLVFDERDGRTTLQPTLSTSRSRTVTG